MEKLPSLAQLRMDVRDRARDLETVVGIHLDRIHERDAELCAFLHVDGTPSGSESPGPLSGAVVAVKDDIAVAGMPATCGSPALTAWQPADDAQVVGRLRRAGARIIGKANLTEWSGGRSWHQVRGFSPVGGQTRNAVDPRRSPGGSSAGPAVAVASGMASVGLGTETIGSVVAPASLNGIAGLKPTQGSVSSVGLLPGGSLLGQTTPGPMARTVQDLSLVWDVLARRCAGPQTTDAWGSPFEVSVWQSPARAVGPQAEVLLAHAVAALESWGGRSRDGNLDPTGSMLEHMQEALHLEFGESVSALLAGLPASCPRTLAELVSFNDAHRVGNIYADDQTWLVQRSELARFPWNAQRRAAARQSARASALSIAEAALGHSSRDIVVSITDQPAWLLDESGDPRQIDAVSVACVAGLPHLTVPGGRVDGLPVGISLIGRAHTEAWLLALGDRLERHLDPTRIT